MCTLMGKCSCGGNGAGQQPAQASQQEAWGTRCPLSADWGERPLARYFFFLVSWERVKRTVARGGIFGWFYEL